MGDTGIPFSFSDAYPVPESSSYCRFVKGIHTCTDLCPKRCVKSKLLCAGVKDHSSWTVEVVDVVRSVTFSSYRWTGKAEPCQ